MAKADDIISATAIHYTSLGQVTEPVWIDERDALALFFAPILRWRRNKPIGQSA